MDKLADEILKTFETCYAYNETFHFYHKESMPRHECEKFVNHRNQCKGGHWQVRRKIDYHQQFEAMKNLRYISASLSMKEAFDNIRHYHINKASKTEDEDYLNCKDMEA